MTGGARRLTGARSDVATPGELSAAWLGGHLQALLGELRGQRLCVAYSGGLDSSVLLAALAALRRPLAVRLRALHVNHHIHPDSGRWAAQAQRAARRLRVSCEVLEAQVKPRAGESLEAVARAVRYRLLASRLQAGELLLTAHHQEDQWETMLLALLRGSGVRGLAAMAPVSPWEHTRLVRPLLAVSRRQIEEFARTHRIAWSEDPSNADERFDRNYLRQRVLPAIRKRWPAAATTFARSATHLAEARALLEQQARAQLAPARDGSALRVSVLARLPPAQRRNALRYWIGERGLSAPDSRRLREIAGPMLEARADAMPVVHWQGGQLRRHGDRLQAIGDTPAPEGVDSWRWGEQPVLALGNGSALELVADEHGDLSLAALPQRLAVSFRRGGERVQGASNHLALKTLLHAEGLTPWERAQVPLIGDGERIIAVADLWLDPAYRAGERTAASARGRLRWQRAGQPNRIETAGTI